jgi:hypothetical protein
MIPTNQQRQCDIAIARAQDDDERDQLARQAEDDSIIDTALLAVILHAIQEDLNDRDKKA